MRTKSEYPQNNKLQRIYAMNAMNAMNDCRKRREVCCKRNALGDATDLVRTPLWNSYTSGMMTLSSESWRILPYDSGMVCCAIVTVPDWLSVMPTLFTTMFAT